MDQEIVEKVLRMLSDDMDGIEGKSTMMHQIEDCPNPLTCDMHDSELKGTEIPGEGEMENKGLPSLDGAKEGDGEKEPSEGLSPAEAEELRKLLK
jgi:hypothetical protein